MSIAIAKHVNRQDRFVELFQQHQGIVAKVARTYCWHPDDLDELSQDIVTQLWRAFPRYDETKSFATWMYQVALNVSISWVRRNTIRQRHMSELGEEVHDVADTHNHAHEDERMALLQTFIETLDPLNRALMLLYLDERSHREISEILGISETNVATRISRLKQRLRQQNATDNEQERSHGTR